MDFENYNSNSGSYELLKCSQFIAWNIIFNTSWFLKSHWMHVNREHKLNHIGHFNLNQMFKGMCTPAPVILYNVFRNNTMLPVLTTK